MVDQVVPFTYKATAQINHLVHTAMPHLLSHRQIFPWCMLAKLIPIALRSEAFHSAPCACCILKASHCRDVLSCWQDGQTNAPLQLDKDTCHDLKINICKLQHSGQTAPAAATPLPFKQNRHGQCSHCDLQHAPLLFYKSQDQRRVMPLVFLLHGTAEALLPPSHYFPNCNFRARLPAVLAFC